jgi:hypothetical protein
MIGHNTCARVHKHTHTHTQGEKPLEIEVQLVRVANMGPFALDGLQ